MVLHSIVLKSTENLFGLMNVVDNLMMQWWLSIFRMLQSNLRKTMKSYFVQWMLLMI